VAQRTRLGSNRPPLLLGVCVSIAAVVAATVLIYPLKLIAPAVSLGVVYLPAVLLISAYWGLGLGLFTALASAGAFNWFHIPPVGRFTIADGRNWVALGAFALVAAVTSTIAEAARARAIEAERRREEADLAAELARILLSESGTEDALRTTADRVAEAIGAREARIELGVTAAEPGGESVALEGPEGDQVATLLLPQSLPAQAEERLRTRLAPALGALIAIALRRDAMQTAAVETAALRRSDELKTALLRSVSHDLKTPLTAIVATGHALRARSLTDQERAELGDAVVEEGERLSGLVEKLLDLSRLQAGRAEPRRDWVALEDVLLAARDAISDGTGGVRFSVAPELPAIRADADQLERAFGNLIENANRYSNGAPVSIRARAVGSRLVVRIVDQGAGIHEEERQRIFEPFYRAPGAAGGPRSGSGLGLAIAKGFIEANGGEISVESLPGQGTTFVVMFPLAASGEASA
jgi:two-component system, OmpR family, sensor histidine kinase KdpD